MCALDALRVLRKDPVTVFVFAFDSIQVLGKAFVRSLDPSLQLRAEAALKRAPVADMGAREIAWELAVCAAASMNRVCGQTS